jgi:hypothetical protein
MHSLAAVIFATLLSYAFDRLVTLDATSTTGTCTSFTSYGPACAACASGVAAPSGDALCEGCTGRSASTYASYGPACAALASGVADPSGGARCEGCTSRSTSTYAYANRYWLHCACGIHHPSCTTFAYVPLYYPSASFKIICCYCFLNSHNISYQQCPGCYKTGGGTNYTDW